MVLQHSFIKINYQNANPLMGQWQAYQTNSDGSTLFHGDHQGSIPASYAGNVTSLRWWFLLSLPDKQWSVGSGHILKINLIRKNNSSYPINLKVIN